MTNYIIAMIIVTLHTNVTSEFIAGPQAWTTPAVNTLATDAFYLAPRITFESEANTKVVRTRLVERTEIRWLGGTNVWVAERTLIESVQRYVKKVTEHWEEDK